MFWDVLISLGLLSAAIAMAWMGVRVSIYPPNSEQEKKRYKIWFLILGSLAAALTIAQGIRNGLSQHDLMETIKNNRPVVNVLPASPTIQVTSPPAPPAPKSDHGPTGPSRIDVKIFPEKPSPTAYPTDKSINPGATVLLTSLGEYRNPVFELKCSVPCTFYPAFSFFQGKHTTSTWTKQLASPSGSPNTIRIRLIMPVKFEPDEQLTLAFRSNDKRGLSITDVRPYLGKDLTQQ
jgi:hypothetical protein